MECELMLKQNSNKHANQECVTCIQALMVHVFFKSIFFNPWHMAIFLNNGNFKYLKMKAEIKMKSS